LPTQGALGEIIGRKAAEAAELMLRVSAYPGGQAAVVAFRQAFIGRYGHHREVPLLELLDPYWGLGALGSRGYANVGLSPAKAAQRGCFLTEAACACLRERQQVLELDADALHHLEICDPSVQTAPVSLDINVQIGARSTADIDAGNFILVIGPNLGAQ